MTINNDVSISLSYGGKEVSFTPSALARFQKILARNIREELGSLAQKVIAEMADAYRMHERERRVDGGPSITERLADALVYHLGNSQEGQASLALFDLQAADIGTSQVEWGDPDYPGWFDLVEDGHAGLAHGSRAYGFATIDFALRKAEECIGTMGLDGNDAEGFRQYVAHAFQGKYGTGIMVRLRGPLFYGYPEFGTASQHGVEPHPGYTAWNIVRNMHKDVNGQGPDTIQYAMSRAMERTRLEIGGIK